MDSAFSRLDWLVFFSYFTVLVLTSVLFSRIKVSTSRDYFVGGNRVPFWAAAVSLLATSQSAATFLGGPEYSFGKDLTFVGFYASALIAVFVVAVALIPKLYAIRAVTVYELLEKRYGGRAKRDAAAMFLVGRLFASGARLYIGALAISMILFSDISAFHVTLSIVVLISAALAYAYFGGVTSVILSDIIQAITYIGAAIAVLVYLYLSLDISFETMVQTLENEGKLKIADFSLSGGFSVWTLLSGWLLLNIAAYGLDQDMTQRALSCKDAKSAARSMMLGIWMTVPVALLFLLIGLLLYLFYTHPGFSHAKGEIVQTFQGDKITVFMYYILHEMPEGLRGLVTVGAIAAALSSSNSVLSAMASVAVEDIYRPLKERQGIHDEKHYLNAGRKAVLFFALALSLMAILSYYWQHATDLPLLNFALGVMAFAYTGLLGVYAAALFTERGDAQRVRIALVSGFVTVLLMQPYVLGGTLLPKIGFAWQMVVGTVVAFGLMTIKAPTRK